ncbi:Zn-ribbon domain-containing OB-fold protein [Peterkaempfera bronchialis]|uniref:Zn-ribbon domain-containing OB-fold protein n=1 Tax=Peterkaempfera bronchialis TaxID=2126346 RepID=A0A345SRD3_9ACTN|nr:Zn-ribbon domain-containing OB-fold protein [Peterkaempfera bronchialis]AXI76288.1 Zn-ribbon domain-containing OB-fold protein [Peterkaempfera bronchialis]
MSKRFVPVPTPETRTFWDKAAEGELWLPRCGACGEVFFYPRACCPHCASDEVTWTRASGRGTVESFVINHMPAPGYEDDAPYAIAFVRLDEGPRLTANIVGIPQTPDHIHVGLPVEVTFEKRGDLSLPQFRPRVGEGARP